MSLRKCLGLGAKVKNTYKQNDTELIFDIDKEVPRFMLADSLHLGQILINLLEYFIQNSQSKEIKLEVVTTSSLKEGLQLQFFINSEILIENKESLFESYYDETSRRYVGLGLFVAKELTY
jgi:K+-sensing histidine kinase KdpD